MPDYPTRTDGVTHAEHDAGPHVMRRRRWTYRLTAVLLTALLALAVVDTASDRLGIFGVDDDVVTASGHGYELRVRYPSVTRPAVASPFHVELVNPDGFGAEVELAISQDYLGLWDVNGLFPEPSEQRSEGNMLVWTFDAPDGDVFRFFYEARIEPARQSGDDGTLQLRDDGEILLSVHWHTTVLP